MQCYLSRYVLCTKHVNTLKPKSEEAVFWKIHYTCQKLNLNFESLDFCSLIESSFSQLFNAFKNQGSQLQV